MSAWARFKSKRASSPATIARVASDFASSGIRAAVSAASSIGYGPKPHARAGPEALDANRPEASVVCFSREPDVLWGGTPFRGGYRPHQISTLAPPIGLPAWSWTVPRTWYARVERDVEGERALEVVGLDEDGGAGRRRLGAGEHGERLVGNERFEAEGPIGPRHGRWTRQLPSCRHGADREHLRAGDGAALAGDHAAGDDSGAGDPQLRPFLVAGDLEPRPDVGPAAGVGLRPDGHELDLSRHVSARLGAKHQGRWTLLAGLDRRE